MASGGTSAGGAMFFYIIFGSSLMAPQFIFIILYSIYFYSGPNKEDFLGLPMRVTHIGYNHC